MCVLQRVQRAAMTSSACSAVSVCVCVTACPEGRYDILRLQRCQCLCVCYSVSRGPLWHPLPAALSVSVCVLQRVQRAAMTSSACSAVSVCVCVLQRVQRAAMASSACSAVSVCLCVTACPEGRYGILCLQRCQCLCVCYSVSRGPL